LDERAKNRGNRLLRHGKPARHLCAGQFLGEIQLETIFAVTAATTAVTARPSISDLDVPARRRHGGAVLESGVVRLVRPAGELLADPDAARLYLGGHAAAAK
jgi:hypothetical protein